MGTDGKGIFDPGAPKVVGVPAPLGGADCDAAETRGGGLTALPLATFQHPFGMARVAALPKLDGLDGRATAGAED